MLCRAPIFALLATAMTFAAEGVNITVNATNDSHVGTAKVTAGSQSMTLAKKGHATWTGWVAGTAYTPAFTDVDTGYTPRWSVTKSGQTTLSGGAGNSINLSQAYTGCTLRFFGQPNTYTVTLDRQDGSGGTSSVTATYDSKLPAPIAAPTRTGYTFGGYFTGVNGGGTQYYAANGYTWSNKPWTNAANSTLYAKWTANTYTVTLDRQDGSGGTSSVTATYDSKLPAPIAAPTRTGYTFGGYFTGVNGGGTQFYAANGYTWSTRLWTTASDASLYAKWTANTCTVTLDKQSGSGGTSSVSATYDSAMPGITVPTRRGYAFGGYYSGTDGAGTKYYNADGTSARASNLASPTTLYAKWTAKTYAITVDPCGGVFRGTSTASTYDTNTKKLVTGTNNGYNIHQATRTGYTLVGYYDAQTGGNLVYSADSKAVDGAYWTGSGSGAAFKGLENASATSLTVYARWTPNMYTVTLVTYGGTLKNGWTSPTNYVVGVGLALPAPTDIEYANHTFVAWYDNEAYDEGGRVTSISSTATGNKTFYAKWNEKTYKVSFDANGGTGRGEQDLSMVNSDLLKTIEELRITAPQGYTFDAWNTEQDGSGDSYSDGAVIDNNLTNVANATVTLYAQWTPNPYEVAFQPNGGDGSMDNQSFIYDVTQALDHVTFTRTGYAFKGWSTTTNRPSLFYADGEEVANLATDGVVNLYANWTGIVYTVTFDANGGEGTMDSMLCTYDAPTNLPACAFTRDGWGFRGWTTNGAEGVLFADGARVTNLTTAAEVTLLACWTGVTYQVTLDARDSRGNGVLATNGMGEAVSVLTNSYVVGDEWNNLPAPTNVNEHLAFDRWAYVDAQGVTNDAPALVPPPSSGATNLVVVWSWVEDPLAAAVDAPELEFATFCTVGRLGNPGEDKNVYSADWFAQTSVVDESASAAQSGALPLSTNDVMTYVSWLTTTVEGRGVLSFSWKCAAKPMVESDYGLCGDQFRFGRYDGENGFVELTDALKGNVEWTGVTVTNDYDGPVTYAWAFTFFDADETHSGGGTGWVDRVTWAPEGSSGEATPTHGVSYSWLRDHFSNAGSMSEAQLEELAESDSPSGKPMKVWEEYWTGTNLEDPNDLFRARIAVTNGVPYISWQPDLSVTGDPVRVYKVLCSPIPSASAQDWVEWPKGVEWQNVEGAATNRFFKVELNWEESRKK